MEHFHVLTRSYLALSLLTLMLIVSLSGMALADDEHKIDLNAATAKQLEKLPGIGKELAKRVVEYRTANGPFESVNDIVKVKGIGKKTFAKVKDLLMIGAPTPAPASQ